MPAPRGNTSAAGVDVEDAGDGGESNWATTPSEPQWQVLASNPAFVEALSRTQVVSQSRRAEPRRESSPEPEIEEITEPLLARHDGLMDTWPGDVPGVGRWWWNARQYVGRLFADVRQGRLRWRGSFQPRVALSLLIALGVVLVFTVAGALILVRIAGGITLPNIGAGVGPSAQPTSGIVLRNDQGGAAPTVVVAPVTLAVWPSNSDPPSFGTIQVYVRVTSTSTFAPQVGTSVSLSIAFNCAQPSAVQGYGPTATDADGMAAFDVTFANLPVGQPACITARASVGGQAYTGTATFAASGGIIASTPTPGNPEPTPTPKKRHD